MALKDNLARLRKERKLSQQALARLIGVRQNTIAAIETGATKRTRYIADLAHILNVGIADLDPNLVRYDSVAVSPGANVGLGNLHVYGSLAEADGSLILSARPIDSIPRPAPLASVSGGYGLIVAGDSMAPLLRPGEVVLLHPKLLPKRDDLCVFLSEGAGETRVLLGEFCAHSKNQWSVKQYRGGTIQLQLSKRDWQKCHVMVGKFSRSSKTTARARRSDGYDGGW
jgi:transcriptional regulator with XRE-family HTH domain